MAEFCLGIGESDDPALEEQRRMLPEQIREITKQILDARSVLNEKPPPAKPTTPRVPFTRATTQYVPLPMKRSRFLGPLTVYSCLVSSQ